MYASFAGSARAAGRLRTPGSTDKQRGRRQAADSRRLAGSQRGGETVTVVAVVVVTTAGDSPRSRSKV